jgi:hypothetical protein
VLYVGGEEDKKTKEDSAGSSRTEGYLNDIDDKW